MLKTLKPSEETLLLGKNGILKKYVQYMLENPDSLISKIMGVYKVQLQMMEDPISFIVLDSLVGKEYHRIEKMFDLKGSKLGRESKLLESQKENSGLKTLKDINFLQDGRISVSQDVKNDILRILEKDSKFLSTLGLIDYSLLLMKVRNLEKGEKDVESDEALLIQNGVFMFRRTSLIRSVK